LLLLAYYMAAWFHDGWSPIQLLTGLDVA